MGFNSCKAIAKGILCALALVPTTLPAFVPSTKALGMALVGVAYPQDAEAGAFNPAGPVWVGNRADFGFTASHNWAKTTIRGNAVPSTNHDYDATRKNFYFDFHGGVNKSICNGNVSIGYAIYNNALLYSKYNEPIPIFGSTNFRANIWQEYLSPHISFKISPCHSMGISLSYVLQSMDAWGIQNYATPLLSTYPTRLTNTGKNYSHGVGYTLGYLGHFTKYITFGASYQPEIKMSKFQKYRGLLAGKGRLNIPVQYMLGVALHPLSCWDVCFEYKKIKYGDIPSLANPLVPNLVFAAQGNPNYQFGKNKGPGFGWKDKESYHLGTAYRFNDCITVRGGWGYTRTWFGRDQSAANLAAPETVENFLTLGTSFWTWYCAEVSLFYIHGFEHKVKGVNSISALSGGGNVDLKQRRNLFGIGVGKSF